MKTSLLLPVVLLGMLPVFTEAAEAQRITFGGGVGFGSQSQDPNLNVGLLYQFPDMPVRLSADVGYRKPSVDGDGALNVFDSNLNAHYMLANNANLSIYGLAGLNVLHSRYSEGSGTAALSENSTNAGANLGVGGELAVPGIGRVYGEAKYVSGSHREDNWVFGAGFRVGITN